MSKMKGIDIERQSDGKVIAKQIRRCICSEKIGDLYILRCRIKELGEHDYECQTNRDFIQKPHLKNNGRKVWLSDDAKLSTNKAIDDFDKTIAQAKNGSSTKAIIIPGKFTLYYKHLTNNLYHYILEYTSWENKPVTILFADCTQWGMQEAYTIRDMVLDVHNYLTWHCLHKFHDIISSNDEAVLDILENSTEQSIQENPIFKATVTSNDIITQKLIKLHYNIESLEETKWLSENVFHTEILPKLPEKYNKDYYVSFSQSHGLLASYQIYSRPTFAMKGHTYRYWTLNPCTRIGVDAAPKDADIISLEEYLELFKDYR
ncbi:MAG: hypothetical protein K6G50_13340 [bacterium]|nr:hypothetical protein [bacterium]